MAEFSMQDAAFTGFRVVREHPKALGVWALYGLCLSILVGLVVIQFLGADFLKLMNPAGSPPADPSEAVARFGRMAPGYAIIVAISLASNAVLGAAMIRAVLRPGEDRFGYLRLGVDELRQFGLSVLTFAVFIAIYLGLLILAGVIAGLVAMATKAAALAVALPLMTGVAVAMIYLAVRLSLAPALTFETGRVNLFGSWTLTRGRFWPLFGTYLLVLALVIVVYMLSGLVIFALGAVLTGENPMDSILRPDTASLQTYFTPFRLVQTVLGAGVSALVWPVLFTPPTAIYQALAPASAAAAFS